MWKTMQVVIVAKLTKRDKFIIIEYVPYHQAVNGSVRNCSIRSLSCWLQMILITMRTPSCLSLRVPTFGVMKTSPSLLLIGFFIYSWDFTPLPFFSLNILGLITREFNFITFSFLLWQCLWFKVIDRTYCSWLIFLLMDTDGPWIVLILKIWTV